MKKLILIILLLVVSLNLDAKVINVAGTIGVTNIHMFLNLDEMPEKMGMCGYENRFYYDNKLLDILFEECSYFNNKIFLSFKSEDKQNMIFELNLTDKNLEGFFSKGKEKQKVLLTFQDDSLEKFKHQTIDKFLKLENSTEDTNKQQNIIWITDKYSEISYPRIKDNSIVNKMLNDEHISLSLEYLSCTYGQQSGFDVNNILGVISDKFISIFTSFHCDSGYAIGGNSYSKLIELKTGKAYNLEDIIKFKSKNEQVDFFKKTIFSEKKWTIEDAKNITVNGSYCNYTDKSVWEEPSWYANLQGIVIIPQFIGNAVMNCKQEFVIPYTKLEKYKNPSFTYSLTEIAGNETSNDGEIINKGYLKNKLTYTEFFIEENKYGLVLKTNFIGKNIYLGKYCDALIDIDKKQKGYWYKNNGEYIIKTDSDEMSFKLNYPIILDKIQCTENIVQKMIATHKIGN